MDARPGFSLRASRPGEADAILAIWRRSVAATHDFVAPDDLAYFETLIRDRYLPDREFLVAADATDRPIAFMGMTGGHIDTLFVDPEMFGRGIGHVLVDWMRARHDVITVDVNEQNTAARRFYDGCGFRQTGRSPLDHSGRPYPLLHLALD
jgi:putative acetyltransferase